MSWRLFVRRTSERPPIPKINQNGNGAPVKRAVGKNKYRQPEDPKWKISDQREFRINPRCPMSVAFWRSLISTLLFLSLILKGPLFFHIDHNSQVSPDDCSTRSSTANAMSSGDCPGTPWALPGRRKGAGRGDAAAPAAEGAVAGDVPPGVRPGAGPALLTRPTHCACLPSPLPMGRMGAMHPFNHHHDHHHLSF